jgi:hypothetical protein
MMAQFVDDKSQVVNKSYFGLRKFLSSGGILIFFNYLYKIEICWAVYLGFYQLRAKVGDRL